MAGVDCEEGRSVECSGRGRISEHCGPQQGLWLLLGVN